MSGKTPDAGVDAVPPGSATLTLADAKKWVPQGGNATVDFTIVRGASVTGALTVHVNSLPAGVTAPDVAVAAGATSGTVTFSATTAAALASSTDVDVALLENTTTLDHKAFNVFVSGAAGALDTTFGSNGKVVFPLPDPAGLGTPGNGYARAIAQYPATAGANAGKLVVAVQLETTGTATTTKKLALVRFNVDGTIDNTFNSIGYALITAANSDQFLPVGLAIDSQGRIAVAVRHFVTGGACNVYVARVTAAGAADTGFTTYDGNPFAFCGYAMGIAAIGGDKLVALGFYNQNDGSQHPTLIQLKSDGTPDTTAFGSSASILLPNPDTGKPITWGVRIYVDSQGRYLVPGVKCEGAYNVSYTQCESIIGRITAAGAWDTTFGTAGTGNLGYSALTFGTTGTQPNEQSFQSLAFDASGNIITVGWSDNYTSATLAKWSGTDGSLDTTFGTSGRVTAVLASGGTVQEFGDVAVDGTGRVVGIGYAALGGALIATTRYSATGTLDSTFGTSGVSTEPAAGLQTIGTIQPDGRILVVGASPRGTSGADLAVWRFWP